jgi:hypothetical protein
MDTTDPDIVFDAQGFCNHCTAYFARPVIYNLPAAERARLLEQIVEQMKRDGHRGEWRGGFELSGRQGERTRTAAAGGARRQWLEFG